MNHTAFANAFASAVLKLADKERIDVEHGQGNWIARRVVERIERDEQQEREARRHRPLNELFWNSVEGNK